ncbi:MAG: hypothetical protein IKJ29_06130 [Akkermansia sp.]|nr:hypothetical protein [Akkermansia sp.]
MFWYCVVVVFRALWLLLVALLMVVLVATMLSAACQQAGGQGLPEGAFGRSLVELVGELRNSLPPCIEQ